MFRRTLSARKPMGVTPPSQRPDLLSSSMLSRMRSAMVSRSSWENTDETYIMALPMGQVVSNCSRMEMNPIPSRSRASISPAKSATLRLMRSRR